MIPGVNETTKTSEGIMILDSDTNNPEILVTKIIREVGVPVHVKGYHYIRAAIIFILNNPDTQRSVTRVVYPVVAQVYNTTPSKVERAIRTAIELAWDHGEYDNLYRYFGSTVLYRRGRPTNCEFLSMIADHIRLAVK